MKEVDDVILPLLRAWLPPIDNPLIAGTKLENRVHDAEVSVDNTTKVVTYATPYVVFTSNEGDVDNPRLSGRRMRNSVFIGLKFVGETREQVKWAQHRVRGQLERRRLDVPGFKTWPVKLDSSTRVWRDDDAIRPDGSPLFYADDAYSVSVMLKSRPALIGATP